MQKLTDTRIASIKPPLDGREEHTDAMVPGLRLRVSSKGRKAWTVRTRHDGKQINKTLGTYPVLSLADARDRAREFLIELEQSGLPAPKRTFGDLAERWIEKRAKVRNKSWQQQQRRLETHVLPDWRTREVGSIKRGEVSDLFERLEDTGAVVLGNRVLATVGAVFNYGVEIGWLDFSPAYRVKKTPEKARRRFLSAAEVPAVWRGAELLGYPYAPYVRALMLTGQRRTETAHMRWAHVDLDAARWIIPGDETKSDRGDHLVPLAPAMAALLNALPRFGDYVFTTDGKAPIGGFSKAKQRLDGLMAATGSEIPHWRLHDLRRTAATHLQRLGIGTDLIGRILNHAPEGITATVYGLHDYETEKRAALEAWAEEVGRLARG